MNLADKTVLVAGGRRLGLHAAQELAPLGPRFVFSCRSHCDELQQDLLELQHQGVQTLSVPADLSQPEQAQQFVDKALAWSGSVDVLLNLTSVYHPTPFESLTPDDFQQQIAANLAAPYWTAVAAGRAMIASSQSGVCGKIINFADWAVDRPYPGYLPYMVAKGGIVTLTKALAVELAPHVTVNAIAPGTVLPPPDTPPETLEAIRDGSLLKSIGSPDDIARLVKFLVADSDFVTGEILRIDGGRFLGGQSGSGA